MESRSPQPGRSHPATGWRLALAVLCALLLAPPRVQADELTARRTALDAQFAEDLEALAAWCDEQGLAEQAERTRQWRAPPSPRQLVFYELPDQIGTLGVPAGLSGKVAEWQGRFSRLRTERAEALFQLARQSVGRLQIAQAMELVRETLREDPDHAGARRLLGYRQHEGAWRTQYEIGKARTGQVWHERFGWLPAAQVARYEAGQRNYGGKWINAEDDARLHADITSGWQVETEHFRITTNHSLEAGVELGTRLERLYRIWQQLFAGYLLPPASLARRFDSGTLPAPRERHEVVCFRSEEEYTQALRGQLPEGVRTSGAYFAQSRKAYFFVSHGPDDGTLYHEVTHQLFSETRPVAPHLGRAANFWVIEGVACYMQSLAEHDGCQTLGGVAGRRLQEARYHLLKERYYLPLEELAALGATAFQQQPELAKIYSQTAGLADFLIHYDGGRYRDALVAYLAAVYSGRDRPGSLAELIGVPFSDLDRQYREFQQLDDAQLEHLRPARGLKQLLLAGTRITDVGTGHLAALQELEELDLAATAIGDRGLEPLKHLARLRMLDLRGTRVTGQGVEALRAALPELDVIGPEP